MRNLMIGTGSEILRTFMFSDELTGELSCRCCIEQNLNREPGILGQSSNRDSVVKNLRMLPRQEDLAAEALELAQVIAAKYCIQ